MARFTSRCGSAQHEQVRHGSRFHRQKREGPALALGTYLSVLLCWGTKASERVPTSSSYTRRPLIGQQNRQSVRQKQIQFPQGISGQRRKLCLLKKLLRKSLPSFLDVLHCCSLFVVSRSSVSLDILADYTVSGCYEVIMHPQLPRLSPTGLNPTLPYCRRWKHEP